MLKTKIAIVNSSSFGQIFPEHLTRLEKIGTVKHFTVDSEIGGKRVSGTFTRIYDYYC